MNVEKNLEADLAGIRPGDILFSWQTPSAKGELRSAFDFSAIEREQGPKGQVSIRGLQNGRQKTWLLKQDDWGITTRPAMPSALLSLYRRGEKLAQSGKTADAAIMWTNAAGQAGPLAPWIFLHAAETFAGFQKWNLADDFYQKAIQQTSDAGSEETSELLLAWAASLRKRDQFRIALTHFQEALEQSRKAGSSSLKIAFILNRLGNVTDSLGDLAQAEKYYLESLSLRRREAPASSVVAATLSNLSIVKQTQGDLLKSEAYLNEALRIARHLSPHARMVAVALVNLGNGSVLRGDHSEAERYYLQALRIQQRFNSSSVNVSIIFGNLGVAAIQQGKLKQAETYIARALAIRKKLAPDSSLIAQSFNDLAYIARQRGQRVISEDYLRKALAMEKKNGDTGDIYFATLLSLALISADKGNLDDAEQYYREGIEAGRSMASNMPNKADWLAGLASIMVRKQQLDAAAQLFEEALNSTEAEAAQLSGAEITRATFRSERASHYLDYRDLLIAQGKPEQALKVLERSRARTLLEMLEESHINLRASIPPDLRERLRLLHQRLDNSIYRQLQVLSNEHTEQQRALIHDEVEGLLHQYQQLEGEVRVSSPAYAALIQPRVFSANEIQEQLLDNHSVLLEYSLGEKRSYVWAVTQNSVECHELLKRAEIEATARQFYRLLTARGHKPRPQAIAKRPPQWARTEDSLGAVAAKLSGMILAPVQSQLNRKRLLIVADGALQYVPFAALPDPQRQRGPGLQEVPLMVEHELVTLPSASVLAALRETKHNQPSKAVAILADPVFDVKDSRVGKRRRKISDEASGTFPETEPLEPALNRSASRHLLKSAVDTELISGNLLRLPRLAFTRREARAILATVPAEEALAALDFKASRTLAISQELSQYRIVHFATHGLVNSRHPELSGLVLSMVDEQGKAQNGFLQLEDIYNLTLPVDLVVLSACDTALGKDVYQEGLIGLTRGFMYAGASRVIASLWTVDDEATAELMAHLYDAIEKDKVPPAAALRKAQLKMWQQRRWQHPYYWAAFQIQGEWK